MADVTAKLTVPPAEQIIPFDGTLVITNDGKVAITATLGDSHAPFTSDT